ncbi:DUF1990 family protein [Protaetiibacter larvae]|uniref:DUF1990 domain-containing protein n=1 Tax=Protaetiibacter larvae TaxID=2592654 RepID=A0A5C1Y7J3_9MICO|nr:DUF1990 domain-containing protein [Protaetiibacter larvae]QEO09801.1 DUF1990 domain-containing protein [Protaetiibacter larvae]
MPAHPPSTSALTYAAVGATLAAGGMAVPAGFQAIDREVVLGSGRELFARAVDTTMRWGVQRGAGIRVRSLSLDEGRPLAVGDLAILRIPLWPRDVPCRVVVVIDEPDRAGFAYGTLPGHPESGEEAFLIELRPDGTVVQRIRAFSRPANAFFRLGYPVLALLQRRYTDRYLRSLRAV